jgi:PPOX class probable F420-dependent enzyme
MILPENILRELYTKWPIARLATVSAHAQPHSVPIVFCEHGNTIYSPIDGKRKSTAALKRFSNLEANPNATLLLDEYASDWQSLWWVRIDGTADLFEPAAATGEQIAHRLLEKYPQYEDPLLRFDTSFYLRLRPSKTVFWSQSNSTASVLAAISSP